MYDEAQLVKLYQETGSCRAVGEVIGKGSEWVRKRLKAAGVQMQPVGGRVKHDILEDELRTLYQTMSLAQLADYYGCGETTVWAKVKKFGITHDVYGAQGHRHRPREFSEAHRQNMAKARKGKYLGERSGNWKGGVTVERLRLRGSREYREWRVAALALRGGKCQDCGAIEGVMCECCGTRVRLHVHHVESFALVPERRFEPTNSEVLCPKCHYSRHRCKPGEFGGTPNA
jgi:hypothetical protein